MVGTQKRNTESKKENPIPDQRPVIGRVSKVWAREEDNPSDIFDESNHEASVILQTGEEEPRRLPIVQDFPGAAGIPKKDDFVYVEYMRSNTERPVITGYVYTRNESTAPLGRAGHWRREFNDLYVEAERSDHAAIDPGTNDYDIVRLAKKSDGLSDPSTQVAIDDSGSTTQVRIETDGDITISAGGDIVIDEGGSTTPVAKQNHTHPYSWTDAGGSGDTGTPNESGTSVELE